MENGNTLFHVFYFFSLKFFFELYLKFLMGGGHVLIGLCVESERVDCLAVSSVSGCKCEFSYSVYQPLVNLCVLLVQVHIIHLLCAILIVSSFTVAFQNKILTSIL